SRHTFACSSCWRSVTCAERMASILVGFRLREPYSPTGTSSHSNLQNDRICDVMRETTVAATGVINGRARRNTLDDFSQCCLRAAHHAGPFDHVCDVSCHSTRFSRSFAVGGRTRVGGLVTSSCHSRRPFRVISLRACDLFGAQVCGSSLPCCPRSTYSCR